MSTVLSNGVIVPDVGSTNWASDLETNWTLLNALIGAVGANVRLDRPNVWTAAQTFSEGIYGDLDGTAAMAVSDANGNEIATTYALKTEVTALQTAVASKAADNEVVHLAGAETISGDKKFQGYVYISKQSSPSTVTAVADCSLAFNQQSSLVYFQTRGSSNFKSYNTFLWSGYRGSSLLDRYGRIRLYRSMGVYGDDNEWTPDTSFSFIDFAIHYKFVNITENVQIINDGTENAIKPVTNNTTDLGTSGNKWKTLNGINPGALSLPSNSGVSFSGDITNTTGTTNNPKTWTVNGWGYIRVPNRTTSDFVSVVTSGSYEAYLATGTGAGNTNIGVSFPIVAGRTYNIYVSTSGNVAAYYFPCLGNV